MKLRNRDQMKCFIKRQFKKSNRMNDYLTYGLSCSSARQNIEDQDAKPLKSEYFETMDKLIIELQRKFSDNDDLLTPLASPGELNGDKMVP